MRPSREYTAFVRLTDRLLAVPHAVVQDRIERHREVSAANPNKRGPKRKAVKPSARRRAEGKP
jgi:hypothetical protein